MARKPPLSPPPPRRASITGCSSRLRNRQSVVTLPPPPRPPPPRQNNMSVSSAPNQNNMSLSTRPRSPSPDRKDVAHHLNQEEVAPAVESHQDVPYPRAASGSFGSSGGFEFVNVLVAKEELPR